MPRAGSSTPATGRKVNPYEYRCQTATRAASGAWPVEREPGMTRKASRRALPLRHGRFRQGGLLCVSLPPGYALDTSDPDALLLLRADGTTAAMFSARGVTVVGILEAAGQDAQAANHVGRETLPAPNGR